MFRCWVLFDAIIDELMEVAEAMADGSYWREDFRDESEFEVFEPNEWG